MPDAMRHFCTYFDHRFMDRGLALYESLKAHCESFTLWVLCMDGPCYELLSGLHLESMTLIPLKRLEEWDKDLLKAKSNRSTIEYYFTCTPVLPLYLFERFPTVREITYLDADLHFYHDPAPIYDEIGCHSIAIIPHGYTPRFRFREKYGIYNVGFIYFRRDDRGLACVRWWRDRCIEWCHARVEPNRFADQKYLDEWPTRFDRVAVLTHKGLNVAAWNMANYRIRESPHGILVDDQPLIFFHFQGLRRIRPWLYDPHTLDFGVILNRRIKEMIFIPYIQALCRMEHGLSRNGFGPKSPENLRNAKKNLTAGKQLRKQLGSLFYAAVSVATLNYIVVSPENT